MTFTIEQLEALKEGTTPGPWEFREHSSYEYPAGPEWGPMQTELEHAVLDTEDNHLFGAYNNYKLIEHPGNLPLAAASPALLDQLIAEKKAHQKLRAEIEAVLDVVKHETWLHDDEGQFPEAVQLGSYVTAQLAKILEGNA